MAVEYLYGLGLQIGLGERFLYKGNTGLELTLGSKDRPGIAGHEEHLDFGPERPDFLRDFLAGDEDK